MFLKSLEMQGFKSFPDKTVVRFNKGLTAIVGPNGSGKSNLSDAMRWVLGEQSSKTLRGEKMEDVIFIGTSDRKPQGFASVSLTFDNADRFLAVDADEVTVSRRYDRSGESEYQINGGDVRLKDINELFMDTGLGRDGYSMIGQGKIAEIVSARSSERRQIFEEAAGISKYRYRKAEAVRKLASAEENLVRLYDILAELEGRVEPLRIQSEKAQAFLKLSQEKKILEISLWMISLEKFQKELKEQQNKYLIVKGEDEQFERQIRKTEEKIQEAYSRMQTCLTRSEEFQMLRQNLQERSARLRQDEAVRKNDIQHQEENISRMEQELSALNADESRREAEAEALSARQKDTEEKQQSLARKIKEKQQELSGLSLEQSGYTARAEETNQKLNQLTLDISRNNMTVLTRKNAAAEEQLRLSGMEQEIETLKNRLENESEKMSGINELLEEIAARQQELENEARGYELKLHSRKQKLEEARQIQQQFDLKIKEKLQKARLLQDLEQNMEGFQYSVKAVMKASKNRILRGILGTVAQLLTVKPDYTTAVETALGGALQNIVTEDAASAKSCIRYLSEQRAGRATFLPVSEIRGGGVLREPGLEREPGFVAAASELVEYDPKFSGIVRFLLGRIAVAEDLDAASVIAKRYGYKFRIVTLDGQQVNVGGSFTGGSAGKSHGILSRKTETAALRQEAEELSRQKEEHDRRAEELFAEQAELKAKIAGIHGEQQTAREDQIRFEGDRIRYEQSREQLAVRRQELKTQREDSARKVSQCQADAEKAKAQLVRLEKESRQLREELTAFQGSQDTLSGQRTQLLNQITGLEKESIICQKDREELARRIQELLDIRKTGSERKKQLNSELERLRTKCSEMQSSISDMQAEVQSISEKITDYEQKGREMIALRQEIEGETTRLRQEERNISADKEKTVAELVRLEEKKLAVQKDYDQIIRRLMDEYEMTRSEAQQMAVPVENEAKAQQQLNGFKNQIRGLGTVNLSAIEEYQEVSQRYLFLKNQVQDASESKQELERLIHQLTGDMERLFTESFEKINRHFGEIFTQLFGGGKASLSLTDPTDVLTSGIEIKVQPPGKIIKNLEALSGGEQAFIAIAIYFSILKVRPSPFCVLDEIEAALDDVNVVKYAEFLRTMSRKTQFILITHRRGSMEEADVLYGVTMQEQGVSRLLELKVSEISAKMAEMEDTSR